MCKTVVTLVWCVYVATGKDTTLYNVQDNGNPNSGFDGAKDQSEVQYFVKWKMWSHIHNTWESEDSLEAQGVNGLKKLDNYKKKALELATWLVP